MKPILTTLLAMAIGTVTMAQNADKALSRVSYTFSHLQDTSQKDKPYQENMLLVIGKNASVYTSYDKINQDDMVKKQLQEQMKNQAGSGNISIKLDRGSSKATSPLDYFFFAKENKFYTKERILNNYLVEEDAPKIDWKISKDTASFSGIHCQKATAYFKGRNWIAWFAPELPFQSGPWKLNGLPGLIIEAYDEKKEVQFQFAGMENVTEADAKKVEENKIATPVGANVMIMGMDSVNPYLGTEIKLPADAIKASRKEIDRLKEAREKDPQGFMKTQMAASGVTMNVTGVRMTGTTTTPRQAKVEINNPIELPERK